MARILRTDSTNHDFIELVGQLDAELTVIDGDEHSFYAQYNSIEMLKFVVVAYESRQAVGCGSFKEYASDTVEIKRMYTIPGERGKGVATRVLAELENWARELAYEKCRLETGKRQPKAIALYRKNGYEVIPNYGQYVGVDNSVCFEKTI